MLIHLYVMIANDAIGTVLYHYSTTLLYIHYTVPISSVQSLGHVPLFATPWTVAYQAPPSVGFSRQDYWSGVPFSSPENLPDPGIKTGTPPPKAW